MKIDDEERKTQIWKDRVNDREGDIEEERKEKKLNDKNAGDGPYLKKKYCEKLG